MAIVLADYIHTAKLIKSGHEGAIAVTAEQNLKIETSPAGEELLDVTCPAGKSWLVRIIVEIEETDV